MKTFSKMTAEMNSKFLCPVSIAVSARLFACEVFRMKIFQREKFQSE